MEVARKSVLDQIRKMKRSSVCRLIFCGKITNSEKILHSFNSVVKEYCIGQITGLLLIYSDFLIHLIEALEDDVFRVCHKLCVANSEIMTHVKCVYVQNGVRRLLQKWYFRTMNDQPIKDHKLQMLEDNFENASNIHQKVTLNLHKLYRELENEKDCENVAVQLDLISTNGHLNIPSTEIEFILESSWGYNLMELLNDYLNLNYPCNFDDYSPVSEIIQEIEYTCN